MLNVDAVEQFINISIGYRWPPISKPYARALAATFRMIVNELISNKDCEISSLNFVSEEDKQKMISWNPKGPYAQMSCMHHLVEATARVMPNSEAVCAWDGSLTYAQLDQ